MAHVTDKKSEITGLFTVQEKLEIIEVFDSSGFKGYGTRDAYTDSKHKFLIVWFKSQRSKKYEAGVCTIEMVDGRAMLKKSWLLELPSRKRTHKEHSTTSSNSEAKMLTPPELYRTGFGIFYSPDLPSGFVMELDLDEGVLSFQVGQRDLGVAFKDLKHKNLHLVFLTERPKFKIQVRELNDTTELREKELKDKLKEQKRKRKAEKKAAKKKSKKEKRRRSPSSSELESSDSDSDSRSRSKKRDKTKKMRKRSRRESSKSDSD